MTRLVVEWPDKTHEEPNVSAGQTMVIEQPSG